MNKLILLLITTSLITACSREEKPQPKPNDLDSRGVQRPLDNETDPNKTENWFTKGPKENVEGLDIERAYQTLSLNPQAKEIIVAVIDGGFDLNHPDLQGRMWINQKEALGQPGIDDDQNGYIDDVNGWNFLGGYDDQGQIVNVNQERLESTRELVRLKKLKASLVIAGAALSQFDQAYYDKLDYEVTGDRTVMRIQLRYTQAAIDRLLEYYKKIEKRINIPFEQLTLEAVEAFKANGDDEQQAKEELIIEFSASFAKSVERMQTRMNTFKVALETALNESFDPRAQIIKDDPNNFSNGIYGNNDVTGPDALHGTHVAGIIAALRDNGQGINGISPYAKIMALRAIPNGDEHDKDIYFAVKYAVDNGAKIINMSFGKRYSPHKSKLDEIFKYAATRGVILVHAAGNFAHDNDKGEHFPNRFFASPNSEAELKNWIEVGASSKYNTSALVANFSNYGKNSVDIFAPGFEIVSTSPNNTYSILSGTSMAAPMVAGVLSVLWAQNQSLSADEIRQAVLRHGRSKNSLQVLKPGLGELINLDQICRTGSVVDSYKALEKVLRL
ncbi:MAG: S8 family serine peptidase [Bdellovibrionota bacterium]